jgi:hypothetical protein
MATAPQPPSSFTPYRRWGVGFQVCIIILLVFSAVVMVNYISRDYFLRLHASTRTKIELSPLTVNLLRSITNKVKVTLYYDQAETLYSTVVDLLNEYKLVNPRIRVQTVDYLRDAGAAQTIKVEYKLGAATDKNLVIFDCEGRVETVDGKSLAHVTIEQIPNEKERTFRRKVEAFLGETAFDAALLGVTNPKKLNAYFLQGHYEHPIHSGDEQAGYLKVAMLLQQNNIRVQPLSLLGTNPVPMDCNLLVIAGPNSAIPAVELEKVEQYLTQGGRLFALFNAGSLNRETGLEKILAKWGIQVGNNIVVDPEHSESASASDFVVEAYSKHPLVNPLLGSGLYLVQPRTVSKLKLRMQSADAPRVEEIAFSGEHSFLLGEPMTKRRFPLMVALEKDIQGVITERGATRIVVLGDSLCLANHQLDTWANRDFAQYTVNWLLGRSQLLKGVGPRRVKEYKLVMTKSQLQSAKLLLLAGMPGAVLLFGGLVWVRRRR